MMKTLAQVFGAVSFVLLVCWIVGGVFSDRWIWSQWFDWIPTLVVLFLLCLTSTLFFYNKRNVLGSTFVLCTVLLFVWFTTVEHRLFMNSSNPSDIKLVGWTMSHSKGMVAKESAEYIVQLDADITLLTHGWKVRGEEIIRTWLGEEGHKVINSQFTLLTKFEPMKVQTLIASDEIFVSSFKLDTSEVLGEPLVLWAVDLPSSLWNSKMAIAKRVQHFLNEIDVELPDIVIGDFNMSRNSVSIQSMFPTLYNVADTVGIGSLASYPMEFPLIHIDHVLFNTTITPTYYELINPHIGRHRIQVVEFGSTPK